MVSEGKTYCYLLLLSSSFYPRNSKQIRHRTKTSERLDKEKRSTNGSISFVEKLHPGRKAKYPVIEEELASWIKENRDKARPITRPMIVRKAKLLAEKNIYREMYPDVSTSKFSRKWVDAFMSRFFLSFY